MGQNLTGIWKADLEKSKLAGPPPKSIAVKIHHEDPNLLVAMMITMPDGLEHKIEFKGPTNGAEVVNLVSGQQWRSWIQWVGDELMIESWVEVGERKLHFRDFWFLSKDGQSLTMEHRDDDLRGQITFLDRA
jgi:hypothetical protein